jgi:hypothetical protein
MTLGLLLMMAAAGDWGYRVEKFEESPGQYYVDKGTVNWHNAMWRTIFYVKLKKVDLEIDSLDSYNDHVN